MGSFQTRRFMSAVFFSVVFLSVTSFSVFSKHPHLDQEEIVQKAIDIESTYKIIELSNLSHLREVLDEHDFDLAKALERDQTIPRVFFTNFPSDLHNHKDIDHKKEVFLHVLLPMILRANEEILAEREEILTMKEMTESQQGLMARHHVRLNELCEKYNVRDLDFAALLRKVDIIPPSLALGQAIIESGWGLSHAAQQKNSPFGMTISRKVKPYESLYESIESYMRNLNSNRAYRKMRAKREALREEGLDIDGHTLIGEMLSYSEERRKYVRKVRNTISYNDLKQYDRFSLAPESQEKAQA